MKFGWVHGGRLGVVLWETTLKIPCTRGDPYAVDLTHLELWKKNILTSFVQHSPLGDCHTSPNGARNISTASWKKGGPSSANHWFTDSITSMKIFSHVGAPWVLGIACSHWGPDLVNTVHSPAIQSLLLKSQPLQLRTCDLGRCLDEEGPFALIYHDVSLW